MSGTNFEEDVNLSVSITVPAKEYAAAAWAVTQLFVRTRSRSRIRENAADLAALLDRIEESRARSIEYMPIALRHDLGRTAHALFLRWPDTLLEFYARCDISAEHFSTDRTDLPSWFEEAIRKRIRRQVRGITGEEIEAARSQLAARGMPVNRAAVAKYLRIAGSNVLDATLGRRSRATNQEFLAVMQRIEASVSCRVGRRSTAEVKIRDAVVLLLATLGGGSLMSTTALSNSQVEVLMQSPRKPSSSDGVAAAARHLLDSLVQTYIAMRGSLGRKRSLPAEDKFFVSFRGASAPARSAQNLLRHCMCDLDPRLARSVSVFSKLLEESPDDRSLSGDE
jgi:hypothetical protein